MTAAPTTTDRRRNVALCDVDDVTLGALGYVALNDLCNAPGKPGAAA